MKAQALPDIKTISPHSLQPAAKNKTAPLVALRQKTKKWLNPLKNIPPLRQAALVEQLADLLETGIPLKPALHLITKNSTYKIVLHKLECHINNGLLFSDAIKKEQKYFDPLLSFFITLGEQSGTLECTLKEFAKYLTKRSETINKIKKNLFYPAIILVSSFFCLGLMVQFLFPTMTALFLESNIELPKLLLLIQSFKTWAETNTFIILIAVAFGICSVYYKQQQLVSWLMNKNSFIKKWLNTFFYWQFFQNTAILINTGIPLLESIKIQETIFAVEHQKTILNKIYFRLKSGNSLSYTLEKINNLEEPYIHMIKTAEQTGSLSKTCIKINTLLGKEIDSKISFFLQWLEPATTIFLGGIVLLFLLLLFYPLTTILNSLG